MEYQEVDMNGNLDSKKPKEKAYLKGGIDCGWQRRSSGCSYNSLSGEGLIIFYTNKYQLIIYLYLFQHECSSLY